MSSFISIGRGGQARVLASHAASGSEIEVYLHGAHVTSYKYDGAELLYTSEAAIFDGKTAIRGGIPIAFPQFAGQGSLPAHGFARTSTWDLLRVDDGLIELELRDSPSTHAIWGPHVFSLHLTLLFGGPKLEANLSVRNRGDATSFRIEALLHAYLNLGLGAVGGSRDDVRVGGLGGVKYMDTPSRVVAVTPIGNAIPIVGLMVDRIHIAPTESEVLVVGARTGGTYNATRVTRAATVSRGGRGAADTSRTQPTPVPSDVVVWNPAAARNAAMKDLDPNAWTRFVCIEPGLVTEETALQLAPGDAAQLAVTYEMLSLPM